MTDPKMNNESKSFYDNVWEVISSKVGNNTDADFLTDRIMDLIKDNIPKPKKLSLIPMKMNNQEIINALNEKIKAAEEALLYLKQSKAGIERVIANSKKSPAEEAFKKVFSHYPDEKDYREGIWFGFQKGFESGQND